jgi:hypothetical protein
MKLNFMKMAIKQLDVIALAEDLNKLISEGKADSYVMYRFLLHVIPQYEATKKQLCADALNQGARELMDWIWEDPMNPTPYSQLTTLKKIAEELKITINDATGESK